MLDTPRASPKGRYPKDDFEARAGAGGRRSSVIDTGYPSDAFSTRGGRWGVEGYSPKLCTIPSAQNVESPRTRRLSLRLRVLRAHWKATNRVPWRLEPEKLASIVRTSAGCNFEADRPRKRRGCDRSIKY